MANAIGMTFALFAATLLIFSVLANFASVVHAGTTAQPSNTGLTKLSFEGGKGGSAVANSSNETVAPFINGAQTGYTMGNLTQGSSNCRVIQRNLMCFTINYIAPNSVIASINNLTYTLFLDARVSVYNTSAFDYFAMLTHINTTATPNKIELLIFAQPPGTVQSTTVATTVAPQNTTTPVTQSASISYPNLLLAIVCFSVAIVIGTTMYRIQKTPSGSKK